MPRPRRRARGQGVARPTAAGACRRPVGDAGPASTCPGRGRSTWLLLASLPVSCWQLGDDAERVALLAVAEELVGGLGPAAEVVVDGEQRLGAGNGSAGSLAPSTSDLDAVARPGGSRTWRRSAWALGAGRNSRNVLAASPASVVTAAGFSMSSVSGGHDVVDVRAALLGEDRLVLVGEEHVAAAVGEGGGRLTAAAGQRDGVVEQLGQELPSASASVPPVAITCAQRGEDVPARRAGGAGVRA